MIYYLSFLNNEKLNSEKKRFFIKPKTEKDYPQYVKIIRSEAKKQSSELIILIIMIQTIMMNLYQTYPEKMNSVQ